MDARLCGQPQLEVPRELSQIAPLRAPRPAAADQRLLLQPLPPPQSLGGLSRRHHQSAGAISISTVKAPAIAGGGCSRWQCWPFGHDSLGTGAGVALQAADQVQFKERSHALLPRRVRPSAHRQQLSYLVERHQGCCCAVGALEDRRLDTVIASRVSGRGLAMSSQRYSHAWWRALTFSRLSD